MSGARHRLVATAAAFGVLVSIGVAAAATPPAYEQSKQRIVVEGRAIASLVKAGDAERIFERFTPGLAQAVPLAEVERILAETLRVAPVGARTAESALPLGPDHRGYVVVHRWGKRTILLQALLDARGRIDAIGLSPSLALARDPHAGRPLRARLSLPFRGTWWVVSGGPTEQQNQHVVAPDQRHAYDLVVWRLGATHRGAGTRNADYWAWGKQILAPAAGLVVEAVDGIRDNRPQVQVENRQHPAGNHVVLDLGHGEYALLAHMRKGSVQVGVGDRVLAGDVLGLTGNSGNSSEPHLHFHIQDRPALFGRARGLPVSFVDLRIDRRLVARGTPVQGQFIDKEADDAG